MLFCQCTKKYHPGSVEIHLLLNRHPFTESILRFIPEYERKTGVKVSTLLLSEEEYFEKLITELSSRSSFYDLFMLGFPHLWQYAKAGWLEPLDPYIENPDLTPADWDPDDFFPELIACSRWNLEQGAGKTTTLKMIAGVEPVTSGEILLNGRPIQDLTPEERDCAMVFETYALYPHLSVYENIAFPLRAPGRRMPEDRIDQTVLRVARILGIDPFLHRRPTALSGGQRQRVALGRTLVRQPAVFLMDEPLSHLDARLRNEMRTEIKAMRESFGTTIVYVTHDYGEALALGDRIAILHQGRIEQVGTPSQVFRRPLNRLVAESLGDPPMNFLKGTIALDQNQPVFARGDWRIPLQESPRLREYVGKEICLGLRPQHIRLERDRPATPFNLPSKLFVQELIGDRTVTSVTVGECLFMVLCKAGTAYSLDEHLYLAWAPEHMYLFLEDTGETLMAEGD